MSAGASMMEEPQDALDAHVRAMARLLVNSGDLTPTGQRQIEAVLDEHHPRRVVWTTPKMTRRARRAALLKQLRGEVDQP